MTINTTTYKTAPMPSLSWFMAMVYRAAKMTMNRMEQEMMSRLSDEEVSYLSSFGVMGFEFARTEAQDRAAIRTQVSVLNKEQCLHVLALAFPQGPEADAAQGVTALREQLTDAIMARAAQM